MVGRPLLAALQLGSFLVGATCYGSLVPQLVY